MENLNEKQQIEEMAKVIISVPPIEFPIGSRMQGKHIYTVTKIAEHLYTAGCRKQDKQEWISVEDRLPELLQEVLCYRGDLIGDMMNTYTYMGQERWKDEYGILCSTKEDGITHWMPLPEAPKMKGGAE